MGSKNSPKIPTIWSQVLGPIKRPFKTSNQPKHYKTLKQSVTSSRIKLLPHRVCRKLPKLVPTCSPRCVEPLCFLVRRNPTIRSPINQERRCSLSKNHKMSNHCISPLFARFLFFFFSSFPLLFPFLPLRTVFFLFVFLFAFLSFPFLISFSYHFFFSFLFLFLFAFLLSLCTFSSPFWSIDRWVKRRKFPPPFLKPNVRLSHFHSFSFIS